MPERSAVLAALAILALAAALILHGAPAAAEREDTLKTYYATILHPGPDALAEFGERISRSALLKGGDPTKVEKKVAEEVDAIVYRVKQLLDMYPVSFDFTLRVHNGPEELIGAWRSAGKTGRPPIAFFVAASGTIHLTNEDLTAGVLAHEIAHAVINSYFETPPPEKMQEILSQYVDRHLWDE